MSLFVAQPVISCPELSEKCLWQAETYLQNLAVCITRLPIFSVKEIEDQKRRLIELLKKDRAAQRNRSDQMMKQAARKIEELTARYQKTREELKEEIILLTGKEDHELMSVEKAVAWKLHEDGRLNGIYQENKQQLSWLSSEEDWHKAQLNHLQLELQASSGRLSELIHEDETLKSADCSRTIQIEINELSVKMVSVVKKAAEVCQLPYTKTLNVDDLIAEIESDLKEINTGLTAAGNSLETPILQAGRKDSSKRTASQNSDELMVTVEQIKVVVQEKRKRLKLLYTLREELGRISRLLKTARSNLNVEMARLKKQKARASVIQELTAKQEHRKQNLTRIRNKLTDVAASTKDLLNRQDKIRLRKLFNQQRVEKIQALKPEMDNCRLMLKAEKGRHHNIVPSIAIWEDSIRYRIKKVRAEISFGNFFSILSLPVQWYNSFQLGLEIRRDLIKVERAFQQLGILDEDYVKQADIFHRKNRKGQQLSLDIFSC